MISPRPHIRALALALGTLVGTAGVAVLCAASASAQSSAEPAYKGSTIRMISGAGPASGYTIWTRFIAEHLPRHVPGEPNVVVQLMAGAGGLIANNWGYNIAPRDGSVIVGVNRETPAMSVMKAKGVMFDATQFAWLGSPTVDTNICAVSKNSPWKSPEDYFTKDLLVGTDGVGSGMHIFPVALNQILGLKFRVIDGYADTGVVLVAADRGEIDGSCRSAETLMRTRGQQIKSGEMRVVLQAGLKPDPRFPGVPFVLDLAKTDEQRQALRFLFSSMAFGRPFVMPPGTHPNRVAIMRKAFSEMFTDRDFLNDAARQGYDIQPTSGEDMTKLVGEIATTPDDIVEKVAKLIEPAGTR